jgi:hypothetical protein
MKGFIGRAVALLGCAGALANGGCYLYRQVVDPCYPERYEAMARHEANGAWAPQVANGHVLDQTIWNYHFEPGSATLTQGGLLHLAYLARRRPYADPVVFLQTAHDIAYDPANPGNLPGQRQDLDAKRAAAIKSYLAAETAGGRPTPFEVVVHNPPPDIGLAAVPVDNSIRIMYITPQATLPRTAGGGASTVGGAGAAGAGAPGGR